MMTLNYERNIALTQKGVDCHFLYFNEPKNTDIFNSQRNHFANKDSEIKQLIQKHQFQVIIVCTYFSFLERLRKMGYSGIIIFEIQGMGDYEYTVHWIEKGKSTISKYADAILYPKTVFLDQLLKKYFPNKQLFSFHNSIDTTLFRSEEVPKPDKNIIGWIGRLDSNKNWQEFLLIGSLLLKMTPNLQLWVFHDPSVCSRETLSSFTRWINNLKLNDALVVHENIPRSKMPYYYSVIAKSNGLVCSTSRKEGFGYAIMEAMCCHCPVLTTRSGGVQSFVKHNVTGKLYDRGDIQKGANEARELIQNQKLRMKMVTRAFQLIQSSFTPKQYSDQFLHMIDQLSTRAG